MRRAAAWTLAAWLAGPGVAWAQFQPQTGTPEQAFAGSPIRLTEGMTAALRAHYKDSGVPIVPQPLAGQMDAGLLAHDWRRVAARRKELTNSLGFLAAYLWEQTRFLVTGELGVAEMHARSVAEEGETNAASAETAVLLWLYAVAVTWTDGQKCADPAMREAHLDSLRAAPFAQVLALLRRMPQDRVDAMRDVAIKLEAGRAPGRTDTLMCQPSGGGKADLRPDGWKADAERARAMLPRNLKALTSVLRQPQGQSPGQSPGQPPRR